MMGDQTSMAQVSNNLSWLVGIQWLEVICFVAFLLALAARGLQVFTRLTTLRRQRIQPLIAEGKTLAQNGKSFAQLLSTRGKAIVEVGKATAEAVGIRTQTTVNVVKGGIPEARRLPEEVAATTESVRSTIRTAQAIQRTVRTAQAVRDTMKLVGGLKLIVQTAREVADTARDVSIVKPTATEPSVPVEGAVISPDPLAKLNG